MSEKKIKKVEGKQSHVLKTKSLSDEHFKQRRIKKLLKKQKRKISFKKVAPGKKEKLTKQGRRTKWAPVWVILKKFGPGKRIHPSAITHVKRSWRHGKLDIRPKKMRPLHYG